MRARGLIALMIAGCAAACGSDGAPGLAGELAAVCAQANDDLDAIPTPTADPSGDPEALAAFFRATADLNRAAAGRVSRLGSTEELLEQRDGLADAISDVADALDDSATAVSQTDEAALLAARDELVAARERFDALAASLGARGCLSGPSAT